MVFCWVWFCLFLKRNECRGNKDSYFPHGTWLENKAAPDYVENTGGSGCYMMNLSEAHGEKKKSQMLCSCKVIPGNTAVVSFQCGDSPQECSLSPLGWF